jgi:hypothetical protein
MLSRGKPVFFFRGGKGAFPEARKGKVPKTSKKPRISNTKNEKSYGKPLVILKSLRYNE